MRARSAAVQMLMVTWCLWDGEPLSFIGGGRVAREDDFSAPVNRELAQFAGYRCSFPGCGAPTVGRSCTALSSWPSVSSLPR